MPGRKRKRTRRRKFSFVLDKACDEQTRLQYYDTLKDRFVRHALPPEPTKALAFVFVFVFVLVHEQAISALSNYVLPLLYKKQGRGPSSEKKMSVRTEGQQLLVFNENNLVTLFFTA